MWLYYIIGITYSLWWVMFLVDTDQYKNVWRFLLAQQLRYWFWPIMVVIDARRAALDAK